MKRPITTVTKVFNANGVEKEKETITIAELKLIKEAVITDSYDLSAPSVMNSTFTKADVVKDLFSILEEDHDDDTLVHYMIFENVLREFVVCRKKVTDTWKSVEII